MRTYYDLANSAENLAKAFGTADLVQQQSYRKGRGNYARDQKYMADAALNMKRLQGMDEGRDMFFRGTTGLNPQQMELMRAFMQGGQWQQPAEGPPTPGGELPTTNTEQPDWYTPAVRDRYNQALTTMGMNLAGTGKSNAAQIADAFQGVVNIGRQDDIIRGKADPADIAKAIGATAGKPMVDVTSSGIAFDRYGSKDNLNTQPFIQKANIDAKAKIDAALAKANVSGGQLPAEAKMVNFYKSLGYPTEQAIEMARSKKNKSLRDIFMDEYNNQLETLALTAPRGATQEELEAEAENRTANAIAAWQRYEQSQGGGQGGAKGAGAGDQDKPPVAGARKAPDGSWYVQKNGQWYRVDQ